MFSFVSDVEELIVVVAIVVIVITIAVVATVFIVRRRVRGSARGVLSP
jgi:hypothetical protein